MWNRAPKRGATIALIALTAIAWAQRPEVRAGGYDFEETLEVEPGTRFEMEVEGGYVFVRTWDENKVQVLAQHGPRDEVRLRKLGRAALVTSSGRQGKHSDVDFEINIPTWMEVVIEAQNAEVDMKGVQAGVDVQVVQGDILVQGGRDEIILHSVNGTVELEAAQGRIEVSSDNEDVYVIDCRGDLVAETLNGDLRLESIVSDNVEGITLNGDILYDGTLTDDGDYYFNTHQGDVQIAVPEDSNLTVSVATSSGEFSCDFDVQLIRGGSGKRMKFTMGGGEGRLRVESFKGDIELFDAKRGRSKGKGKG